MVTVFITSCACWCTLKNKKSEGIRKYCRTYGGASCCPACQGSCSLHSQVIPAQCPVTRAPQQLVGRTITGMKREHEGKLFPKQLLCHRVALLQQSRPCCPSHPAHAIPHTPVSPHALQEQSLSHLFCYSLHKLHNVLRLHCVNKNIEPLIYGRSSLCMTKQEKHGFSHQPWTTSHPTAPRKAEYFTSPSVQRTLRFRERNTGNTWHCWHPWVPHKHSAPCWPVRAVRLTLSSAAGRDWQIPAPMCTSLGDSCDETSRLSNAFRVH